MKHSESRQIVRGRLHWCRVLDHNTRDLVYRRELNIGLTERIVLNLDTLVAFVLGTKS